MASTALVGALRASLSLDTAAFEDGSKRAISQSDKLAKNITRTLKAITAGVTFQQIVSAFQAVIDHADKLQESAQKLGLPIEQLTALELAAEATGTSFETLSTGVARLSRSIQVALTKPTGEAARAFQTLGINIQQIGSGNTNDALLQLADAFNRTSDGSRKLAASVAILGRGAGVELIPLLNQGRAELERWLTVAENLGIVIDQRTAVAADRFNDNMLILRKSLEAIVIQLTAHMLPALVKLTAYLADTSQGASPVVRVIEFLKDKFNELIFSLDSVNVRFENLLTTFRAMKAIGNIPLRDLIFGEGLDQAAAIWDERGKQIEQNFRNLDIAWAQLNNSINGRGGIGGGGGIGGQVAGTGAAAEEAPLIAVPKKAKPFWDGLSRSVKLTAEELGKLPPLGKELGNIFSGIGGELGEIFLNAAQGTQSLKDSFKELVDDLLRQVIRLLADRAFQQFLSILSSSLFPGVKPGVGPGGLGSLSFGGPRAAGGRVGRGRSFLVGEGGPELFVPRTAGSIVPTGSLGGRVEVKIIDQRTTQSAPIQSRSGGDGSTEFIVRDTIRKELPSALNRTAPGQFGLRPRLSQRGN